MRASPRVVSGSGCGHNTSNRWRDAHSWFAACQRASRPLEMTNTGATCCCSNTRALGRRSPRPPAKTTRASAGWAVSVAAWTRTPRRFPTARRARRPQAQAEDPAPRRPSAAAPDLVCGCLPSGIAQQPRRSQPRPPPGFGGYKIHHEPSDRDHNGPRGGIAPGSPASARSIPRHCTIRPPAGWPRQQRGEEPTRLPDR